jgi:hypothetical protein
MRSVVLLFLPMILGACQSLPPPPPRPVEAFSGLSRLTPREDLDAWCAPPLGWCAEPLKESDRHTHQLWISPTGDTAYGVIRIRLPLPVGPRLVLWKFMEEMRRSEGEGELLSRHDDAELPGIRFVAEGGKYKVRTNILSRGFTAWAVYAGTLRARPENLEELDLAIAAREQTITGLSRGPAPNDNLHGMAMPPAASNDR